MLDVWIYTLVSVLLVSFISIIGIFAFSIKVDKLKKILIYLVAFSAGALFGDAFLHLLPELIEDDLFNVTTSFYILGGILIFFFVEKVVHWHHCHSVECHSVDRFAVMNLVGDGVHNFLDGLIIAGSYLVAFPVGIATTIAVALHEVPQEIGDFGILIHGGFSKKKALGWNLISALFAVVGAVVALTLNNVIENIEMYLVPLAIGGFIYIAGSDLIPELHKEEDYRKSLPQFLALVLGIIVMALLLFLE